MSDQQGAETRESAKHTPGPWQLDIEAETTEGCRTIIGSGFAIASTHGLEDDDEDFANARLFAAALELHAVAVELDRLMLVIESAVRHADPTNHAAVIALITANRAALAKAGAA